MVFCDGWNTSLVLLWLKGGGCVIDMLVLKISLAWLGTGLTAGWIIGWFMGVKSATRVGDRVQ